MIQIVPAIIPKNFKDIEDKVSIILDVVDMVAIDIVDGLFATSTSWPFEGDAFVFQSLIDGEEKLPHPDKISYEIDLMVKEPLSHALSWLKVGAKSFVFHIGSDSEENLLKSIKEIKQKNANIGIAIKPMESNDLLKPFLDLIDFVQLMGNDKIGYGGVELDSRIYQKIKDVREINSQVTISIDIGVNRETAPELIKAGAEKLISNSAIFKAEDPITEINFYKSL